MLTNTQIINWSYVPVTSIFFFFSEMTFIRKDFAYGAENAARGGAKEYLEITVDESRGLKV